MKLNKIMILAIILILSLALRIYQIERESLWLDEGITVYFSQMDIPTLFTKGLYETHPPLYYVILHFWIELFGVSELAIRSLSVFFNLITIIVVFRIGCLLYNSQTGLLASLLVGFSAFNIEYSQEARNYSMVVLFSTLSFLYFIKLLKTYNHRDAVFYCIFSSLLVYTHIVAAFVMICTQNIFILLPLLVPRMGFSIKILRWLLLQFIILLIFSPWVANLAFKKSLMANLVSWIPSPGFATLMNNLLTYSGSIAFLICSSLIIPFSVLYYQKITGKFRISDPFNTLEKFSWQVSIHHTEVFFLLFLWAFIPMLLLFVISKVVQPIYLIKVTIGASIGYYILIAAALSNFRNRHQKAIIITIVAIVGFHASLQYLNSNRKEGWRQATNYIESHATSGDLVIFNSGTCLKTVYNYYARREDLTLIAFPHKTKQVNYENIKSLPKVIDGHKKIWVVLSHTGDSKGLINQTISQDYDLLDRISSFKDIVISRYTLK
jgi:uncharacterized membrane protein